MAAEYRVPAPTIRPAVHDAKATILFLCTGNSARSILAEAIANRCFGERLAARSAGSRPRGEVNPLALETLRRHGIETAGLRSKSWDEVRDEPFDLVLTLCDEAAAEACPTLPGAPARVHWSLPDPAADKRAAFEAVYETLVEAITPLAGGPVEHLARRAETAAAAIPPAFTRQTP